MPTRDDTGRFITTPAKAARKAANQRRNGHAEAIALLRLGLPVAAQAVVWETFEAQVETLGWHLGEGAAS